MQKRVFAQSPLSVLCFQGCAPFLAAPTSSLSKVCSWFVRVRSRLPYRVTRSVSVSMLYPTSLVDQYLGKLVRYLICMGGNCLTCSPLPDVWRSNDERK